MSGFAPRYTDFYEVVPAPPAPPVDDAPKGTPLVSEEDVKNAENVEDFKLARRPEGELPPTDEKKDDKKDDDKKDKKSGEGEAAAGDDDDSKPGDGAVRAATEPEPPSLEDPGEFKPKDYSFEVVVYDAENKNPKAIKIKSMEQFEELVEKDGTNFGSPAAFLKANRLATKMDTGVEADQANYDKAKEAFDNQEKTRGEREKAVATNMRELKYLVDKGDLPKVATKYQDADWDDPEVADQPGVREQKALFEYIAKENRARKKAGVAQISSLIDGFNAYERSEDKKKTETKRKEQADARKAAGGRVASASPAPVSTVPKGISVGRTGLLK